MVRLYNATSRVGFNDAQEMITFVMQQEVVPRVRRLAALDANFGRVIVRQVGRQPSTSAAAYGAAAMTRLRVADRDVDAACDVTNE